MTDDDDGGVAFGTIDADDGGVAYGTTDGDERERDPRIIAHRGFAGVAPENTLAAFEAVADGRHPAAMIELDVMPCADGTPVVFHDVRLDGDRDARGITDGEGVVWETPSEVVRAAKVLDTDQTVPTLAEVLDSLPTGVGVNVELKNPGTLDLRPGEALAAAEVTARRELWDPFVEDVVAELSGESRELLVSSFCEAAIASVRELAPEVPVAPLLSHSIEDGISVVERYECEAIHPRLEMIGGTPFFEQPRGSHTEPSSDGVDVLAAAADLGCAVNVWTVRTWRQADTLRTAGVDGLIADYPGLLAWERHEASSTRDGAGRSREDGDDE